jgi:hypothetical protein
MGRDPAPGAADAGVDGRAFVRRVRRASGVRRGDCCRPGRG